MNTASKLTHLEVCAPAGGDVEDLDAGDDGEERPAEEGFQQGLGEAGTWLTRAVGERLRG